MTYLSSLIDLRSPRCLWIGAVALGLSIDLPAWAQQVRPAVWISSDSAGDLARDAGNPREKAAENRPGDTSTDDDLFRDPDGLGWSDARVRKATSLVGDDLLGEAFLVGERSDPTQPETVAWDEASWTELMSRDPLEDPVARFVRSKLDGRSASIHRFGSPFRGVSRAAEAGIWGERRTETAEAVFGEVSTPSDAEGGPQSLDLDPSLAWMPTTPAQAPGFTSVAASSLADSNNDLRLSFATSSDPDHVRFWSGAGRAWGSTTGPGTWVPTRWTTQVLAVEPAGSPHLTGGFSNNLLEDNWRWCTGLY